MRQIKFRGKRIRPKGVEDAWVYGSLIQRIDSTEIHDSIFTWNVIPDTVSQFTGLVDRNGKEIYEGDILGVDNRVIGHVVGGVRGYCYDVIYANPKNGETNWSLYGVVENDYSNRIEIIGNIFDNPELLNEKQ